MHPTADGHSIVLIHTPCCTSILAIPEPNVMRPLFHSPGRQEKCIRPILTKITHIIPFQYPFHPTSDQPCLPITSNHWDYALDNPQFHHGKATLLTYPPSLNPPAPRAPRRAARAAPAPCAAAAASRARTPRTSRCARRERSEHSEGGWGKKA